MRIISGKWRGRVLQAPKGQETRPTADRTREALFSMLISRLGTLEDLAVADLFAGSGTLGFEALSRGAATCLFVEQDRAACDAIRANADKLGIRVDLRAQSVLHLPSVPQPLDLIIMDPPYGTGAGNVALDKLARLGWIGPATLISLETAVKETVDAEGFEQLVSRTHGKARLTLLRQIG